MATPAPARTVSLLKSQRLLLGLAGLLAILAALWAYWPPADKDFVFDDTPIIVNNPLVTQPGPCYRFWLSGWWPKSRNYPDVIYRPVTLLTFRLNTLLAGDNQPDPRLFYWVNLLIHIGCCGGVFALARRLSSHPAAGPIAALLFAVHPINSEAITTGYGRAEVLAGFLTVWLLARHAKPPRTPKRSWFFCLGSGFIFLTAIMSKEHALFAWPILILIDRHHRCKMPAENRPSGREWLNRVTAPAHIGYALALSIFFALRTNVFGWHYRIDPSKVSPWENPLIDASWTETLLTPFRLLWLYATLLVQPHKLCPVWAVETLSPAASLQPDVIAGMALLVALLLIIIWNWWRGGRLWIPLLALLSFMLIPTHALPAANWIFAERWLYLPTAMVAVALGLILARWIWIGPSLALTAALVLLPATWNYSDKFTDNTIMQSEVVLRQPNNYQGRRFWCKLLYRQGHYAEAVQQAHEMIERFGPVKEAYRILILSYLAMEDGRLAMEAMDQFTRLQWKVFPPDLTHERRRAQAMIDAQTRPAQSAPSDF